LRKREIVLAVGAGAVAATLAGAILSGNDGPGRPMVAVNTSVEQTYELASFSRISTTGPQDVVVTHGDTQSVRGEGSLGRLDVVVENGELIIRPRNGGGWNWGDFDSTTLYVTVPELTRASLNGSGDIRIDNITGERFEALLEGGFSGDFEINGLAVEEAEFTVNGPGDISASGTAESTRVTINGPGELKAGGLKSETATVMVRGPGDVELAVEREADVSVDGPGEVDIDGPARCTLSTSGPGSVSCGDQESD